MGAYHNDVASRDDGVYSLTETFWKGYSYSTRRAMDTVTVQVEHNIVLYSTNGMLKLAYFSPGTRFDSPSHSATFDCSFVTFHSICLVVSFLVRLTRALASCMH